MRVNSIHKLGFGYVNGRFCKLSHPRFSSLDELKFIHEGPSWPHTFAREPDIGWCCSSVYSPMDNKNK